MCAALFRPSITVIPSVAPFAALVSGAHSGGMKYFTPASMAALMSAISTMLRLGKWWKKATAATASWLQRAEAREVWEAKSTRRGDTAWGSGGGGL